MKRSIALSILASLAVTTVQARASLESRLAALEQELADVKAQLAKQKKQIKKQKRKLTKCVRMTPMTISNGESTCEPLSIAFRTIWLTVSNGAKMT